MECSEWEDIGLLYTSKELGDSDRVYFERHMQECPACLKEYQDYCSDKKIFALLEETPSPGIDLEICRVCTDPRPRFTFAVLLKRALVPVLLFVFGFISTAYVTINLESSRQVKISAAVHKSDSSNTYTRGSNEGISTVDMKK